MINSKLRYIWAGMLAWGMAIAPVHADNLAQIKVNLDGAQCTPPVSTKASGHAELTLNRESGEISGTMTLMNIDGKKAHIHLGKPGEGGKVLVTLEQKDDATFVIPEFTTMAQGDVDALMHGGAYLQVHTAQYPKGELRGQIMP